MRRIVTIGLALAALSSCDPTGNIPAGAATADIRFVDLVVDVPAIDVYGSGVARISDLAFGQESDPVPVNVVASSLETRNSSDGSVLGTESVDLVIDRQYTFYALGKITGFQAVLAADDITFADATHYRARFVHGLGARSGVGLDVYLTAPATSLSGLSPSIGNTAFGAASGYVAADTSFRRLRITSAGLTTVLFDTTFAAPFADSTSLTFVVSDKQGGGAPIRLQIVTDKTP